MRERLLYILFLLFIAVLRCGAVDYTFSAGNGMSAVWNSSDVIGLYTQSGSRIRCYISSLGADAHTAQFSLGGWTIGSDSRYYAYAPYSSRYVEHGNPFTSLPITFAGQQQTANDDASHLTAFDYMMSQFVPQETSYTISYTHLASILRIEWAVAETMTVNTLTLSAPDKAFTTDATMNLLQQTTTVATRSDHILLAMDNVTVTDEQPLVAYLMIAPTDLTDKVLTLTLTATDGTTLTAHLNGTAVLPGKVYPVALTVKDATASAPQLLQGAPLRATLVDGIKAVVPDFTLDADHTFTVVPNVLKGDVNDDGVVDVVDAIALTGYYISGKTSTLNPAVCDMNNDGTIDLVDVIEIRSRYLRPTQTHPLTPSR